MDGVCMLSHVWLFVTHGLQPVRRPSPWSFPDKDAGVSHHFLLQGIFPESPASPELAGGFFTAAPPRKPRLMDTVR